MTCQTAGGEILGIPARVPLDGKKYLHNQRLGKVVVKHPEVVNLDYLYWLFLSPEFNRHLVTTASGTKILHTSPARICDYRFHLPPLAVQQDVAETLFAIEERIDTLRSKSRTLESVGTAIFKSWFVDFDQARAKAEGRDPEGMDAKTAALFPSSFAESEVGQIPMGWKAGSLMDLALLNPEAWSAKTHPESLLYVDLGNAKENRIDRVLEYSFSDAPSRARRVLRSGDTIVGTVRPGNRSYAFIASAPWGLTGSTGFAVLRPTTTAYAEYVYLAATRRENIERLAGLADGGAYPAVSPDLVYRTPVVIPPATILRAFSALVGPLLQRQALNRSTEEVLTELRDTLLPRLISGQLRIPEAEEAIEEVLA